MLRRGRNREEADRCRTLLTADFNQTQIASVGAQIAVLIKEKRTNPSLVIIAGMVEVSILLYRNVLVVLLFWTIRETDYELISDCCRCLLVFYNRNEVALGEVTYCWPSRGVSSETLD